MNVGTSLFEAMQKIESIISNSTKLEIISVEYEDKNFGSSGKFALHYEVCVVVKKHKKYTETQKAHFNVSWDDYFGHWRLEDFNGDWGSSFDWRLKLDEQNEELILVPYGKIQAVNYGVYQQRRRFG